MLGVVGIGRRPRTLWTMSSTVKAQRSSVAKGGIPGKPVENNMQGEVESQTTSGASTGAVERVAGLLWFVVIWLRQFPMLCPSENLGPS